MTRDPNYDYWYGVGGLLGVIMKKDTGMAQLTGPWLLHTGPGLLRNYCVKIHVS